MQTEYVQITDAGGAETAIDRASDALKRGGLVVIPTETVYGVAARADDAAAVDRLRNLKDRGAEQAFTLHLGSPEAVSNYVPEIPGVGLRMISKGLPGPLTLIFNVEHPSRAPIATSISDDALATIYHANSIGIRCPDDAVCRAILDRVDAPIIAASANDRGQPPPVDGHIAHECMTGRVDVAIDAGTTRYAKASTIVKITGGGYELLREGVLDAGIIDRLSKLRILMVCTGNTCRSPMAEGLGRKILAARLGCHPDDLVGRGIEVSSAGTSGGFGRASEHAVSVMSKRDIDLSDHGSTQLTQDLVRQADHIFTMTRSHRDAVLRLDPSAEDRLSLVAGDRDVSDPIGGSEQEYEDCANMIADGLTAKLKEIPL